MPVDPVTAAKAIGGLLGDAKTVVAYIEDVKDANEDKDKLLSEIEATQTLLQQLQNHENDGTWKETMEALNVPRGPFEQLRQELKHMETKLKPSNKIWKRGAKALVWHFTKDGIRKHFDRIERLKGILQLALQNNHMYGLFVL